MFIRIYHAILLITALRAALGLGKASGHRVVQEFREQDTDTELEEMCRAFGRGSEPSGRLGAHILGVLSLTELEHWRVCSDQGPWWDRGLGPQNITPRGPEAGVWNGEFKGSENPWRFRSNSTEQGDMVRSVYGEVTGGSNTHISERAEGHKAEVRWWQLDVKPSLLEES